MALLTPLSLLEASELARAFDIDLARLQALPAGSVNSNFRLEAADGRVYFGRLYEEQGRSGAAAELALLEALGAAGVPVARPLRARDGANLLEHHDKPWAIFPWVEGEWLCLSRVTPEHCRAVGEALAAVHRASASAGELPLGRFRPADMLARLERVVESGPARLLPSVERIRERYAEYVPRRDPALPTGICHGDLFRDNVLWHAAANHDARIAALLDFESVCQGSFAYDLMVTLFAWCFTAELDAARAEAMLRGYRSARALSEAELAALPVEGALACLRFATTRITDFEQRAPAGGAPARDFHRFLTRLEALERGALGPPLEASGSV